MNKAMIAEPLATDRPREAPRRPWRVAVVLVLAAALVATAWWAWAASGRSVSRAELRLATVTRGELLRDAQVQGRTVASASPTLFAPAAGTVTLEVQAGDTVAAGQVLARIASPELAAERAREAATLLQLEAEAGRQQIGARQQQLAARRDVDEALLALTAATRDDERSAEACSVGVISIIECQRRKDAVEAGRIRQAHATRRLELVGADSDFERQSLAQRVLRQRALVQELDRRIEALAVRAPLAARVGSVAVADRAAVAANAPLMTVVDLSRLDVELQVPELYAGDLGLGMKAELRVGAAPAAATLVAIAPEVQQGQVLVRARFDGAQPEGLRQNQRLSGRIVIERKPGVLQVERGPFVEALGGHAVYVLQGDEAVRRPLVLGSLGASAVEVVKGLQAGDVIVAAGSEKFDQAPRVRLRD